MYSSAIFNLEKSNLIHDWYCLNRWGDHSYGDCAKIFISREASLKPFCERSKNVEKGFPWHPMLYLGDAQERVVHLTVWHVAILRVQAAGAQRYAVRVTSAIKIIICISLLARSAAVPRSTSRYVSSLIKMIIWNLKDETLNGKTVRGWKNVFLFLATLYLCF